MEARLGEVLRTSAQSARQLAEEKDKLKTLVSDIAHQTRTPVANLLLYAQLLEEQDLTPQGRACVQALEGQGGKSSGTSSRPW